MKKSVMKKKKIVGKDWTVKAIFEHGIRIFYVRV